MFVELNKFFEDGPNIGHPLAHLEKFDLPSMSREEKKTFKDISAENLEHHLHNLVPATVTGIEVKEKLDPVLWCLITN